MKYLSATLVLTLVAMTTSSIARAGDEQAPTTGLIQGATLLKTQPASVNQSSGSGRLTPYSSMDLNNAATSLQANPKRPAKKSILPDGLVQQDSPGQVNPLDFFKVPALDGGVKFKIGQD